jgi:hypothetical protein
MFHGSCAFTLTYSAIAGGSGYHFVTNGADLAASVHRHPGMSLHRMSALGMTHIPNGINHGSDGGIPPSK